MSAGVDEKRRSSRQCFAICVDTPKVLQDNSGLAFLEGFPSGQRDQTVNLTAQPSEVQILPPPPNGGIAGNKRLFMIAGVLAWRV